MLLSVCMIVKNEEKMLEKTLVPLAKAADEIILVDTGSTDGTKDVAKRFGARIHEFAWIDDFSAARNESLKHAQGEWIIWVDGDEYIKEEYLFALKSFLEKAKKDIYALPVYECEQGKLEGSTHYFRNKVLRNHQGYHFERPINEQLRYKNGEGLKEVECLVGIKIAHWGKTLAKDMMQKKVERNIKMFEEAAKKHPNDLIYHFLLAQNYYKIRDYEKAIEEYSRVVEIDPKNNLAVPSYTRMGHMLLEQGQNHKALAAFEKALSLNPEYAEALNLKATVFMHLKNFNKAIETLKKVLSLKIPAVSQTSINQSHYTYLPNFILGNIYLFSKRPEEAREAFVKAYEYQPSPKLKIKIDKLDQLLNKRWKSDGE